MYTQDIKNALIERIKSVMPLVSTANIEYYCQYASDNSLSNLKLLVNRDVSNAQLSINEGRIILNELWVLCHDGKNPSDQPNGFAANLVHAIITERGGRNYSVWLAQLLYCSAMSIDEWRYAYEQMLAKQPEPAMRENVTKTYERVHKLCGQVLNLSDELSFMVDADGMVYYKSHLSDRYITLMEIGRFAGIVSGEIVDINNLYVVSEREGKHEPSGMVWTRKDVSLRFMRKGSENVIYHDIPWLHYKALLEWATNNLPK